MERNREVGSMARRRHRITSLRDSPDGDREVLNDNKRRRVGRRFVEKRCSRDEEEEEGGGDVDSTDESFNNVEDDEDDRRTHRNRAFPSSSSVSSHVHRQNVTPARGAVRSSSAMRITDEMVVGVPVPRKARSASTKRSHEERSHQKYTSSPVRFGGNRDGASPSSSSGSLRNKKMKSLGIKTRLRFSKRSMKSSAPIQDDIEIEVAEALFDLMKQSQSHSQLESESSMKQERSNYANMAADDKSICSPVNIVGANGKDAANGKEAALVQNGLVTEVKFNNDEKEGIERCLMKSKNVFSKIIMAERIESNKEESVKKEKDSNEVQVGGDMVVTKEEFAAPKEASQPCAKPNADNPVGLALSKADLAPEVTEEKRAERFEIDLMAPPLPSSPERDGLTHTASDHPPVVIQDTQMKSEVVVKAEDKMVGKGQEEKKIEISYSKGGLSKLDLKMPYQENVGISSQQERKEPSQSEASIPGGQKFAQLSSFPFPIAGTGWPTSLPNSGCMPPLQIATPVDGSARSVIALQKPPPFSLFKPRPKRYTTHQYIARSIQFHQQLIEKSVQPAAAATLGGAKPHNLKPSLLGQSVISGNTSPGDFPGRQTLPKVSGLSGADKSSRTSNNVDATNGKQLMLQQGPKQAPTANMLHGQALIFQLGQHSASKAPTDQSGPLKSGSAVGGGSMPSDSSGGASGNSSACRAGTTAVSSNHAKLPSNAAPPYMAIFPNNGYPFSFSANVGGPALTKGGSQAPIMPFHNGSYYSSPMFQIPQGQPKQPHSQPQVHTSSHDTSTSNGSSSSQVQPHNKPQIGAQISLNTYFPPMSMPLQQPEKQRAPSSHSAGKPAAETSQKNVLVADSHASHSQKSNNNQNFAVPIQPINLAYVTPGTLRGNMGPMSINHSEEQQQGTKGGVQLMPPQAFELSFNSTASTAAALNFSSMAQHPAVFQMLPDMGRQMFPFAPGTQMTQQKNFQMPEGKILVGSISNVEERKGIFGKFPVTAGQSLNGSKSSGIEPSTSTLMGAAVFDSSGQTLSFVQLPVSGSQTFPSSSTLPMAVVPANTSNSQHQHHQQLHFQKQNQQMQLTGTTKFKEPISNAFPCTFITMDSPNNYPLFSQTLVQTSSSAQSSSLNCLHSSQVSSFNVPSLKGIQQQQLKNPQSQTHIAFGNPSNTATTSQGQKFVFNNQFTASLVGGSPATCSMSNGTSGNVKTAPTSSKSAPTSASSPSQQIEASRSTPSQKSSPVCGRNLPSILSTSPSQLSELY